MIVLYYYDSNAILSEPLKNNMTSDLARAQTRLTKYLLDIDLKRTSLRIDNECLEDLILFFRANSIDFHLCPPNNHRTNKA